MKHPLQTQPSKWTARGAVPSTIHEERVPSRPSRDKVADELFSSIVPCFPDELATEWLVVP